MFYQQSFIGITPALQCLQSSFRYLLKKETDY